MNPVRWLLKMRAWAQHPPSPQKVWLVLGVVGFCLILVAVEKTIGWPEWLTLQKR
jgi:hypothetical protein